MGLDPGQKLGPYEIEAPAGAGGMGEVYRAKDTRLDRTVAIKVLPARTAENADMRARFEREAKAISSLSHPNICTLHDVGHQDGTDYLVMEYIEGETVAERLKKGALDLDEALDIGMQIADALDKAHRQGLVHRDLKPANVMLTVDGAKLLDFGLAKLAMEGGVVEGISGVTQTTPLTGAGTIIGTIQYMSPEQLEGEEADARSDIFAFGALIYEMVSGQPAFSGKSQATLIASIIGTTPQPVSKVQPMTPPALERLIRKCLEKDPDRRWQSARDLADDLRWIAQSGSQAGLPAQVARRRHFKFTVARVVGAVAILLLLAVSYLYYQKINEPLPVLKGTIYPPGETVLDNTASGSVALSPDGSKLAFVGRDTLETQASLYVRSLNTLTALKLPGTEGASFPFWSPDGEYIAFFTQDKLKKILATGGPALTICDASNGRPGSWNEDDIIIFSPDHKGPLHRVAAAGGEPEQLTALDSVEDDYTHRYATFLPDGDKFLFFARIGSGAGGERDAICLSSLSDTSITRLIFTKSNPGYANGHLLFMREEMLMAQPFDAGSGELSGDARPLAEEVTFDRRFSRGVFGVSNTGQLVYRKGAVQVGRQLMIYSDDFSKVDTLGEMEEYENISLSHDNRFIALEINDEQTRNSDIWIYDLNRNIKRRLTFDSEDDRIPVWSPDDSFVVYTSFREDNPGLYMRNSRGSDTAQLVVPSDKNIWCWDWSPDGRYLILGEPENNGTPDIVLYDLENPGETIPYLQTEFLEGGARVSPDGRWCTYTSFETGQPEVYVSTFPQHTAKWQVSTAGGFWSKWSPDGRRLYYTNAQNIIHVAEVDGTGRDFQVGKVEALGEASSDIFNGFELFDDEERFLAAEGEDNPNVNELIHVYNWPAELKK